MATMGKNEGMLIEAYELGTPNHQVLIFMLEGKVVYLGDNKYRVFSQASTEIAEAGDFFQVDSEGFPSPQKRDLFLANHRHVKGDFYEQLPTAH